MAAPEISAAKARDPWLTPGVRGILGDVRGMAGGAAFTHAAVLAAVAAAVLALGERRSSASSPG